MKDIIYSIAIVILIIFLIGGILSYEREAKDYENIIQEQKDSISSLTGKVTQISDSLDTYKVSINDIDSLIFENYTLKYKINRIKQYDSIVIRNSGQSKYFRGWVRRVIYE